MTESTPESPALKVSLVLPQPQLPLVLCSTGFMTTLANAEAEAKSLTTIKDAVGAQAAASLLQRATTAKNQLNKQRLELTRVYQQQIDVINAAAKVPDGRLDNIKRMLSKAQTDFALEQARLTREAEAKRLKDLADLEAKLAKERKEAADKAAAIAEQVRKDAEAAQKLRDEAIKAGLPIVEEEVWVEEEPAEVEVPQKSATELAIEAVKFAPAVEVVKAAGVRMIVTLCPHVRDVNKLPDMFVTKTAKLAAIQSVFCRQWADGDPIPVLDGVEFEVQRSTQSTGRSVF